MEFDALLMPQDQPPHGKTVAQVMYPRLHRGRRDRPSPVARATARTSGGPAGHPAAHPGAPARADEEGLGFAVDRTCGGAAPVGAKGRSCSGAAAPGETCRTWFGVSVRTPPSRSTSGSFSSSASEIRNPVQAISPNSVCIGSARSPPGGPTCRAAASSATISALAVDVRRHAAGQRPEARNRPALRWPARTAAASA